ncbi:MAG: rhodanese-like domain-containing protein [Gammaproteobacteria bacterium]|nr:rhodanese-like domain-containing protein [Gammaproteobacteria bacterium]
MPEQIFEFSANHPILTLSFISLLGLILFIEFRNFTQKFTNVGPAAAVPIINQENTVLLDIREMSEIKDGMLNNAIHIPLSAIGKRIGELDKFKDNSIVVYCRSGNRSTGVCRTLTGRGFDKVYNLAGGIMAWHDAHLPIGKSKKKKK